MSWPCSFQLSTCNQCAVCPSTCERCRDDILELLNLVHHGLAFSLLAEGQSIA